VEIYTLSQPTTFLIPFNFPFVVTILAMTFRAGVHSAMM